MSAAPFWSKPKVRRITELTITTAFWFAWFYLILPLISLMLWLVGYQLFVDEMLVRGGYVALLAELRNYGLVLLVMGIVMLIWIKWNQRHYGLHNKRTHQPVPLTVIEQAAEAGLSTTQLLHLQASRRMTADFDDQDRMQVHN